MIVALVPLKIEFKALCQNFQHLPRKERIINGVTALEFGENLILAIGGHGKVRFALSTQALILDLKPDLALGIGSCGGLNSNVEVLDTVVATEIIEHDYNLKFINKPLPRFECTKLNIDGVKYCKLASGDEDITSKVRAQEIHAATGADVVAWESAGLARAAQAHNIPFAEIRVVTDLANESTMQDFNSNITLAMAQAAQVLQRLVSATP